MPRQFDLCTGEHVIAPLAGARHARDPRFVVHIIFRRDEAAVPIRIRGELAADRPPNIRVELDIIKELVRESPVLAVAVASHVKFLQPEVAQSLH